MILAHTDYTALFPNNARLNEDPDLTNGRTLIAVSVHDTCGYSVDSKGECMFSYKLGDD